MSRLTRHHQAASKLVFIYYIVSVYVSYQILLPIHLNARSAQAIYRWPVAWVESTGWTLAPQFIAIALFVSALACAMDLNARIYRILFAVSATMSVALLNSYGAVNHGYHIWLWIGLIFALAPDNLSADAPRSKRLNLLAIVSGAQLFVLLTYTMAGFFKVRSGVVALLEGDGGNFSMTGFSSQIADRVVQTNTEPFAADMIISNGPLFAPFFWILIFAQLMAIPVFFFPRLHRSFGLLLIMFHFGTWALMEISFPLHVLWLLMFFVFSPFRPTDNSDSPVCIAKDVLNWSKKRMQLTGSAGPGLLKKPVMLKRSA